jgi:hypothetical protein
MKKIVLLFSIALLFSSCIGIKSSVTFNHDGTGTISMEYRISKMITEMGQGEADVPLPISEEELSNAVSSNPDLTLKKVSQREDERDVYITAEVEFKEVSDFTDLESFEQMPMSLEQQGSEFIFKQRITEEKSEEEAAEVKEEGAETAEMDEEAKQMMAAFFEGYELSFTVNAPTEITSHNLGELSPNRKSVTYTIPIMEMESLEGGTVLEVRWKR